MVRQQMIMDEKGAIFFMMNNQGDIKVLKIDPSIEMGDDNFVKSIFTLRSSDIYFFLYQSNKFYIMDNMKKIRIL